MDGAVFAIAADADAGALGKKKEGKSAKSGWGRGTHRREEEEKAEFFFF